ncbi:PucR family transcriptional regulator [Allosaccharopolyspora coralli]|nr:PucR family transcriptional regulator [Allosaccharopolyspora coralli]
MRAWMALLRPATEISAVNSGPASSAATVAEAARILGEDAAAWAVETAATITEEVKTAAQEDADLALTGLERRACEACLLTVLGSLRSDAEAMTRAPQEAVEQVRLAVRQGTAIDTVLRVVWMCHTAVQDRLLTVISEAVPPGELVNEVRVLSRQLLAFVDLLVRELSAAYEAERAVWQNRITAARRQVVDEILRTSRASDGAESVLGIRLTGQHLAGVLWTDDAVSDGGKNTPVARYVSQVASRVGAAGTLVLELPDGSTGVVWSLPGTRMEGLVEAVRVIERPRATSLALGPVGTGVAGFRHTVLGARQAASVGRRQGTVGAWAHDDVALLALLLADPDAAGRYVLAVLGDLTGADVKSAAIRETLAAYLRHGRSRTAAAQELSLAANTVAYRVRQAEQLLGRPATERATDTVIALLLTHEFTALLE